MTLRPRPLDATSILKDILDRLRALEARRVVSGGGTPGPAGPTGPTGPAGPSGAAGVDGTKAVPPFTMSGPLSMATSPRWYVSESIPVTTLRASLGTAGGSTTTVVLMVNGVDVATINLGSGVDTDTDAYVATFSAGEYIQTRTTALGTGAENLSVQVY